MKKSKRTKVRRFKSVLILLLFVYFMLGAMAPVLAVTADAGSGGATPATVLALAKKHIDANEHEKALQLMQTFVAQYPGAEVAAEVYVQLAKCEKDIYEKKRFVMVDRVIKSYETVIEKYPYSELGAQACFQIGQLYEKEIKDNAEALKYYEKCVIEYPVTSYAASSLYRTGQINEAEGYFDMAVIAYERLSRDFSRYQIAVDALLRVKDIYATKMEENYKTIDKTIEAYYEVIGNYPENKKTPEILMELAKYFKEKKSDTDNSIKTYQQVIERFPKDKKAYEAFEQIAKIHGESKDYKSVAAIYNKMYETYPEHENAPKTLFDIAQIYETDLREYKKKRIDDRTYFRLEKTNLNEAIKYYTKVVDTFPQSKYAPTALMKIANILNTDLASGLEAKLMYQAVVEKYPDSKEHAQAVEVYNKMR